MLVMTAEISLLDKKITTILLLHHSLITTKKIMLPPMEEVTVNGDREGKVFINCDYDRGKISFGINNNILIIKTKKIVTMIFMSKMTITTKFETNVIILPHILLLL